MAPARHEEEQLRPFVGDSGALLRRWLDQTGLLERSAFANIEQHRTFDLTCRYCGVDYLASLYLADLVIADADRLALGKPRLKTHTRKFAKWAAALDCKHSWKETHANREPNPKGEECGLPLVEKLLATRPWKAVLCWGAVPARAIGGYKGSVGSMVGRFRTLPTGQSVTVLYHPAYALRKRGSPEYGPLESLEREILRQVHDRLELDPARHTQYPWEPAHATPTGLYTLAGNEVVDVETDTAGKTPDPRLDSPNTLCLGHHSSTRVSLLDLASYTYPVVPGPALVVPRGARLLMHNAQYDLPILMAMAGHTDMTADDTMVEAYLLGEQALGLKVLARRLLGVHAREYLEKTGPDDREYDAQDIHLTRMLHEYFQPCIHARGLDFLYNEVKVPLQKICARHTVEGLLIDQIRLATLQTKMEQRASILLAAMRATVGHDFNPASPQQVNDILYDELGIPLASINRQETRTSNEKHIGQFRSTQFVNLLLSYRTALGYLSRYCRPLSALKRVSGEYSLTGTGTDRISQSNRNCMNFPGLVKQCIQADEGGYFVYGDYSQVELRLAAYFSRDSYLLGVLREGRNMHEELCLAVYGARTPDTYTQAKSANFAKLFGAGLRTRARTLKMPVSVVKRNEIPWLEWDAWVASRRSEPARTYWGYERNVDDNRQSSEEYLVEKANRQIINSIIQGTAGEITQYAEVLAEGLLGQLGGKVVHQEHDSVLCWVPASISPSEACQALSEAMRRAVPEEITSVIEVKAKVTHGDHWG